MSQLHRQNERERIKRWEALNPEKVKARQARYGKTDKAKARLVRYSLRHPERRKETYKSYWRSDKGKACRARNRPKYKEKEKSANKVWRESETGRAKVQASARAWSESNRDKIRAYSREHTKRFWATPRGKLIILARNRIRNVFRSMGVQMPASASKMIGCDWDTLKAHIESQFTEGMTWENYGQWHCDHKDPIASFDLTDPEQVSRCFSWRNLQPLWAVDNLSKGAKLVYVKKNSNPSVTCP